MTDKVLYIAIVLTKESQRKLFKLIGSIATIPNDWRKIGHHITVAFKESHKFSQPGYLSDYIQFGDKISIAPIGWRMDEKGLAVSVLTAPSSIELKMENPIAHITVAVAPGISPFDSNQLLEVGVTDFYGPMMFLDGHLVKVLPKGKTLPEINDLADDTFIS